MNKYISAVLADRKDATRLVQQRMLDDGIIMSCINCERWKADRCEKFAAVPPPKVIAISCVTDWELQIPF